MNVTVKSPCKELGFSTNSNQLSMMVVQLLKYLIKTVILL
ncbi:Uncharacterised protein [Mycobacteroides abscessus subsp. abscessus]|nr:Uncharacterised protein [Mycobacteroides abscessus subsp. abscessus]